MWRRTRAASLAGVGILGALAITAVAGPASAAPGDRAGRWAQWGSSATPTVSVAPGFPDGLYSSTDPAISTPGTPNLTGTTPPGLLYGTSAGANRLAFHSGTASFTTVIDFASPTPASGWSLALADVDAEAVTITATGPGGPLAAEDLGIEGSFNFTGAGDQPVWDATTSTLRGNTGDTTGASAWFSPTRAISRIELVSTRISASGNPVAYLWLAASTASLAGSVVDSLGQPVAGATVEAVAPGGGDLPGPPATAVSAADGTYEIAAIVPAEVELVVTAPDREPGAPVIAAPEPQIIQPDPDSAPREVLVYADPVVAVAGALLAPVAPAPAPPAPVGQAPAAPAQPELAATGADIALPVAIASALVLAGIVFAVLSRRRAGRDRAADEVTPPRSAAPGGADDAPR